MSRKASYSSIKLSIGILQTQSLDTNFSYADIPFETLTKEENLHLPPALPTFQFLQLKKWYVGIPVSAMATVFNTKNLPIKNLTLKIVAKDSSGIVSQREITSSELAIGCSLNLTTQFIPQRAAQIDITSHLVFTLDGTQSVLNKRTVLEILQPITIQYKSISTPQKLLQFTLKNMLPFIIHCVNVKTDGDDNVDIGRPLQPDDVYSGIIKITKPYTTLISSFMVHNCPQAYNTIQCQMEKPPAYHEVYLNIEGIPVEWPALKPFCVTLHATNITNQTISGKIVVAELNDSIFVFGNNNLTFNGIEPNATFDMPIKFIAMKQGTYKFPSFDFYIEGGRSFRINNDSGIIVVGHYDDENE